MTYPKEKIMSHSDYITYISESEEGKIISDYLDGNVINSNKKNGATEEDYEKALETIYESFIGVFFDNGDDVEGWLKDNIPLPYDVA